MRNHPNQNTRRDFFAAVATAASGAAAMESAERPRRPADAAQIHDHQDSYDDGLVHNHGWAVKDR